MTVRILLVEDNPGDVLLLREALAVSGRDLDLEHAGDGRAALARLARPGAELPDLVVMDLNLPDLRGAELLAALRSAPVAVAVLSGSDHDRTLMEAQGLAPGHFLVKPDSSEGFLEVVARLEALALEQARRT